MLAQQLAHVIRVSPKPIVQGSPRVNINCFEGLLAIASIRRRAYGTKHRVGLVDDMCHVARADLPEQLRRETREVAIAVEIVLVKAAVIDIRLESLDHDQELLVRRQGPEAYVKIASQCSVACVI